MAAYVLEDKAHISTGAAVASVAAPVGVLLMAGVLLIWLLTRRVDATHGHRGGAGVRRVGAAGAGRTMGTALLLATLAPWVVVVGIELTGR